MSGTTIGGFAGAAIGFVVTGFNPAGAQWGFMIGSAVGGYLDPAKQEGPRITDAQTQTSNEGVPRPIVYGKAAVAGNIIQCGPLVEHKKKQRGSKGGPEVTTYTYTRTVAIRICEAAPLGGTMVLRRAWMDDKLVYDASQGGILRLADSKKFAASLTFYSGSEDQLPDPSLEALPTENGGGVGNVPAYRGTCYAVLTDLDCTDRQGSVPQFRWEVCSDATQNTTTTYRYVGPDYSRFTNDPSNPLSHPWSDYTVLSGSGGNKLSGGGYTIPIPSTIQEAIEYAGTQAYPAWGDPNELIGISRGGSGPYSALNSDTLEGHGSTHDMTRYREAWLSFSWQKPVQFQDSVRLIGDGFGTPSNTGGAWHSDSIGIVFRSYVVHDTTTSGIGTGFEGFQLLALNIRAKKLAPVDTLAPGEFLLPDLPGYASDTNGNIRAFGGTATFVSGSFRTLALESSNITYTTRELGPVRVQGAADDTQANWEADYAAAVAAGEMPSGYTYSSTGTGGAGTYPRNTTGAYRFANTSITTVAANQVALASVVADLAGRVGIPSSKLNLTALAGKTVRGYPVARETTADAAILELMRVFFFELPEWGNSGDTGTKLRAVLRGGASALTLTEDDIVDDTDDDFSRPQVLEFPRKLSLTGADPDANYEAATEVAERESESYRAVDEQRVSTSVILTRDELAATADKMQKLAVAEATGNITRKVPMKFSAYTPSDCLLYGGKRYRIVQATRTDSGIEWEMKSDRISSVASAASGSDAPTPTTPPSNVRGPTILAVMNLPSLRSADNVPGVYVAAQGVLSGWAGADIYLSVDDGASEQKVATFTAPSTIGVLTDDCTDSSEPISVQLYQGGVLDSVTPEQIAARLNGFAIITDGVSELGQFEDADETSDLNYDLTNVTRGQLGTVAAAHAAGDMFVLLDEDVQFLPLDAALAGKTLIFRAVSIGTAPENNPTMTFVFDPPVFVIDGGTTL